MDAAQQQRHLFKVVVVGESGVGKSSLLARLRHPDGTLPDVAPTIGMDTTDFTVADTGVRLSIWDTAGQERFRSLTAGYYRNASAIVFVYDITNGGSFSALTRWLDEADLYCTPGPVVRILVGNKSDVAQQPRSGEPWREVTTAEARAWAGPDVLCYETSAKCDGPAVQQLFQDIGRAIVARPATWHAPRQIVHPGNAHATTSSSLPGCC